MKGRGKGRLTIALAVTMIVTALMMPIVNAYSEKVDQSKPVTLTLEYLPDDTIVEGVQFDLYYVGSITDDVMFVLEDQFTRYRNQIDLEGNKDPDWNRLAETLKGFVERDGLSPMDTNYTNVDGKVFFPSSGRRLYPGLYLVLGSKASANDKNYYLSPMLFSLPYSYDGDVWTYDVIAKCTKYTSEETNQLKVIKTWVGEGRRNAYIEVDVLCDGELYETVRLDSTNNWEAELRYLEPGHEWSVAENNIPQGYTSAVERNMYIFQIENTIPETPDDTPPPRREIPFTGTVWWPFPVLLLSGSILFVIGLYQRKRGNAEA